MSITPFFFSFYSYFPFTFFLLHFSLFLSLPPLLHRKPSILIHTSTTRVDLRRAAVMLARLAMDERWPDRICVRRR
jgi:hypothetical protein